VGKDGVVRYTLVARSPQGAESVVFEGMRCATREVRGYATGRADGGWSRRDTPWRAITPRSVQRWHDALAAEYLCPGGTAIHGAAEGVDALRRGGHPRSMHAPEG
jgi:CNP1-like family protein